MKTHLPKNLFLAIPLILILSCTIQKKHYSKGYYVEPVKKTASNDSLSDQDKTSSGKDFNRKFIASSNHFTIDIPAKDKLNFINTSDTIECDTIVLINGKKIGGKIKEVTSFVVSLIACSGNNPNVTSFPLSQIKEIRYSNGKTKKINLTEVQKNQEIELKKEGTKIKSVGAKRLSIFAAITFLVGLGIYFLALVTSSALFLFLSGAVILSALIVAILAASKRND